MDWLSSLIDRFIGMVAYTQMPDVQAAGERALQKALADWQSDIFDPPRGDSSIRGLASKKAIDRMLLACGWTWEVPYEGDGSLEWCGLACGSWWRSAGLRLDIAKTFYPSTYRLNAYARYRPFDEKHKNERPAIGPYRMIMDLDHKSSPSVLPWQPRAGDIVIMGPSGVDKHIELCERVEGDVIHTVGGNAGGRGPDGKWRQGVVRARRAIGMTGMRELGTTWHVRHVIRPAPADLE